MGVVGFCFCVDCWSLILTMVIGACCYFELLWEKFGQGLYEKHRCLIALSPNKWWFWKREQNFWFLVSPLVFTDLTEAPVVIAASVARWSGKLMQFHRTSLLCRRPCWQSAKDYWTWPHAISVHDLKVRCACHRKIRPHPLWASIEKRRGC